MPSFSVHPDELVESTKKKLNDRSYFYANSNAGMGWTDRANRYELFLQSSSTAESLTHSLQGGVLPLAHHPAHARRHEHARPHQSVLPSLPLPVRADARPATLFGHRIPAPILFAPIGINKLYSPQGELVPAKIAGELGLPYCLSTAGSQPIEAVAAANDAGGAVRNESNGVWAYDGPNGGAAKGPRFFQLYMGHDDEIVSAQLCVHEGSRLMCLFVDRRSVCWRGHGSLGLMCACLLLIRGSSDGGRLIST